jgi:hypothetical protein
LNLKESNSRHKNYAKEITNIVTDTIESYMMSENSEMQNINQVTHNEMLNQNTHNLEEDIGLNQRQENSSQK